MSEPATNPAGALEMRRTAAEAMPMIFSPEQIHERVQLVQNIYRTIMLKDTHFGVIPGCKKPSLWKPGSEQLLSTFRIAVKPEVIDLSNDEEARFRVHAHCYHMGTGVYLGTGIGEASSKEKKYRWREAVCQEEFDAAPPQRQNKKWMTSRNGAYYIMQVATDFADISNTILKMAKKRAQIDATLTITAASDIFTQDIEDLAPENRGAADDVDADAGREPVQEDFTPRRKDAPQAAAQTPAAEPAAENELECTRAHDCPCQNCSYRRQQQQPARPAAAAQPSTRKPAAAPAGQQGRGNPAGGRPAPTAQPQGGGATITEGQSKRFYAVYIGNGATKEEAKRYLKQRFGITDDRQIPAADYDEAMRWAETGE